ncbi:MULTISPECIES: cell division protein FtsL [Geobacillus]|uniref:Cell division protein FtsL n=2 Tax=Geobacillus thermodenitrificans TaxID=33940 RepID=A4IM01_GEOTN|nr:MULTISPECIES: cell division protein FtsL [Geobacillus]NNU85743.1 cell division protein FtsL [Geobacillus sp. MR]ABO66355.1 Cell division protein FtsL protein [Geobacillus thermodenitrificans NG80-2]ARP42111.1 Cell division protein FtsL [Geobacillus thermodenitrificans]ATO36548.1 cell division protein FtsL [Geobacillus thermodenitrificans]KQB93994.1 cell division protein FtsL [Geobacillus sp. PA-3]
MNNLAVKVVREQKRPAAPPSPKPQRKRRFRLTLAEKLLIVSFLLFAFYVAVQFVSSQVQIYELNKDIQKLETAIDEQKKENNDLYVEVQQLSSYERILQKAKELGLSLNEDHVKVVKE